MMAPRTDIFISYAHNDNHGSNWVSTFVQHLGFAVTRRLGRAPRFYFDSHRLEGNETEEVFEREAASAHLFVPILSPSFVEPRANGITPWTLREMDAFLRQPGASDRIYPVEILPIAEDRMPASLQGRIRKHRFWQPSSLPGSTVEVQLDPVEDRRPFTLRVEELAARLSRHIQALEGVPTPQAAARPAADDPARQTILLGQVTVDLEDEATRLRRYLEQFGHRVLPEDTLPQGGAEFAAAFADLVGQATLFVQLLGPLAERRPKDLPEGYTVHQYATARSAGLPCMLWCRPDLPTEARSAHRDADLFATADTTACGIEEFKSSVVARLQVLARPAPVRREPAPGAQIFINSDRVDMDLARSIAGALQRRSASVYLPVFEGAPEDIIRDLRESLAESTGIIIVFGAAPAPWVRSQLRYAQRIGAEAPGGARKTLAVYLHPPRSQSDVGVLSPHIVWIDGSSGAHEDAISHALIGGAS